MNVNIHCSADLLYSSVHYGSQWSLPSVVIRRAVALYMTVATCSCVPVHRHREITTWSMMNLLFTITTPNEISPLLLQ